MKELTSYNRVAGYLNKVFNRINAEYFENSLEMPTITIQSTVGAYGHVTTSKIWQTEAGKASYELNVGADYLARPIENVVATLIHEACHLYAMQNGIKDTSNRGVYHNTRFKDLAEARGLIIERHEKYGWTLTSPSEETINFCIRNDLQPATPASASPGSGRARPVTAVHHRSPRPRRAIRSSGFVRSAAR